MRAEIKYILLFITAALAAGTGYHLYDLHAQGALWGKWPIVLLTSQWLFVVLLFEKKYTKNPKGLRWLGLSTLSGVLLSLGFPTLPLTFLMFGAFVPLLMVEKEIADEQEGTAKWEVLKYTYHTFVLWNILTTYWVANTAFVAAFVAILLNALFMCVPFLLFHQTKKVLNPRFGYLALAFFWMAFEYGHLRWEISWPWLTLGNSFAQFPSWVQWYEYTGVFGGTFWILLTNIFGIQMLESRYYDRTRVFNSLLVKSILLVTVPLAVSFYMYTTHEEKGVAKEVVIIQPNYEPHYEKFTVRRAEQVKHFIELSKQGLSDSTDYLLFPETVFLGQRNELIGKQGPTKSIKDFVDKYPGLKLVTGLGTVQVFKGDIPKRSSIREHTRKTGEKVYYENYNSAVQMTSGSDAIPIYYKSKLVPGAEITPYVGFFWFLEPFIDKLGGSLNGHGTQIERSVFKSGEVAVAPVICYESIYGEYTTRYMQKGGNVIFIVTNDGWWDDTDGHRQHLAFASLRAIETRRSIARAANTGISAFVNQRGDILQATAYGEDAVVKGKVHINNEVTFYMIWGDLLGRLSSFAAFMILLSMFVNTWKLRKKKK